MDNDTDNSMDLLVKKHMISKSKLATITQTEEGTKFTCIECSAQYDDKEVLELHLFSHFHTYRFLCGVCGTGLKRKEHLDRHMQEHTEYRPHICPQCGKAFKRKEHLNIHRTIHKGNKNFMCTVCSKTFYRNDHLQKHLKTHKKHFEEIDVNDLGNELDLTQDSQEGEELTPIITSVTGAFSESSMEADETNSDPADTTDEQAVEAVILDNGRPHVCSTCGKSYKRKDHLKIHSWTHKKKEVLCNECGKAFHTTDQMMVHVNLVHLRAHENNSGVMQLRALLGDQIDIEVVNDPSSLLVPMKKQSPDGRPHECPVCHRKFKRKQHLKIHANVHFKTPTQMDTVWCAVCNEGFPSNAFSNHNCQWSNQGPQELEFEPGQWNGTGDIKKENHPIEFVEVVVGEEAAPTPRRVFVCKYCSKPFKRKDHYKIHLHIHTGIKSFFCPDCGKGFYRKDHLQKHMIVHARTKKEVQPKAKPKPKKSIPDLFPIEMFPKKEIKPEITIRAPSNSKLRVPLQMKVPYQMVSMENGEKREVTVEPQSE